MSSLLLALLLLAPVRQGQAWSAPDRHGPEPDSAVAAAAEALARGLPWRATRLLDPVLNDSLRRSPEAVLLAARAAGRWGGWALVARLLEADALALTGSAARAARLLSARAALELGRDSAAAAEARALLGDPAAEPGQVAERGEALVLLARALERLNARDSAAATYLRAVGLHPPIAEWLALRAAQVTDDSAERAALYAGIANPAVRARIPNAEATIRERTGDLLGAARVLEGLGARVAALALRLRAVDAAGRDSVRRRLVALLGANPGPGEARAAAALLDSAFAPLEPAEELAVARAVGDPDRAAAAYQRALAAGLGAPEDRFAYAATLGRLGAYRRAVAEFGRVPPRHPLGGAAAYQRARALLRDGQSERAVRALRAVLRRFPRDTAAAAPALALLADVAMDDGRDEDARGLLLELARRFPRSRFTPGARLGAALIALTQGRAARAGTEFDSLAASRLAGDEATAAAYWAGRAWALAGDTARARERWQALAARDPTSYYAGLVERRMGLPPWAPSPAADSFAAVPALDSALDRAAELARLGFAAEAATEYDQLVRDADQSLDRLLATARALEARGFGSRGIRLARRALARGAPADARLYRLLYPVVHADALLAEAAGRGLDPSLVAALIRQESMFDPAATSRAGARGLMQVMPEVGRAVARSLGFPVWDPVLLYQPDVSLELGTARLADLARTYAEPVRLLAAYNAGVSRVERWRARAGSDDPEIFADRIPFAETRDYVRIIQRNRDFYRALYRWPETAAGAVAPEGGGP